MTRVQRAQMRVDLARERLFALAFVDFRFGAAVNEYTDAVAALREAELAHHDAAA